MLLWNEAALETVLYSLKSGQTVLGAIQHTNKTRNRYNFPLVAHHHFEKKLFNRGATFYNYLSEEVDREVTEGITDRLLHRSICRSTESVLTSGRKHNIFFLISTFILFVIFIMLLSVITVSLFWNFLCNELFVM